MRLMRFLICALCTVGVLSAHAAQQASAPNASVQRLSELLGKAQTLTGRFTQLSLDSTGTRLQESKGEMVLKRPGLFRWHTDKPMEQLLVSNGEKIWLYDPDLEQVTIRKLDKRMTHTPALLLSGSLSNISEHFEVSHQDMGDAVEFKLRPKGKDSLFDALVLSFRKGIIFDMQLVDNVGQRTRINFTHVVLNEPQAAENFVFEIPPGTDVIAE